MARPGPKKQVSDLRLLLELFVKGEYALAAEVHGRVSLDALQSVRDRLNELEDSTEYVEMKKVSGRNLYRLTDSGEDYVLSEVRARVD